ncbi:hypothetical protein [Algibacter sp. PT7-4]|uniref:hypothetical protein n=1 Tax=Algibacter ulvanivorans TaxID=3400999 RepID=UPI003AACC639
MNNLEIIILTKQSLREAINHNKFWDNLYEAPFSINKAKWMLKNARAEENDTFAILGYEKYKIIAFVYLVPDLIKIGDNKTKKIFWSQRWWVSNKFKETVLSTYVKNQSLVECNNQVVVKFLGEKTKAFYNKQPFQKFSKRNRYIIIFSIDYDLLVLKKKKLRKLAPILKVLDKFSRVFIALINTLKSEKNSKGVSYTEVSIINNQVWQFIEKQSINDFVLKSKAYINWQIDNNQYQSITESEKNSKQNCLLGTIAKKIYNINDVIKKENTIIGFISCFISGNRMIVRYFVTTDMYYDDCLNVLIKKMISNKCTILQTEDSVLGERISKSFFKIYADKKELVSLIHNAINQNTKLSLLKDQDGNFF